MSEIRKVIIVDDELIARKRISNLLEESHDIKIVGEYGNGQAAVSGINDLSPEIVFLDIRMKDMTGFEVLTKIKTPMPPVVIFTTAYDTYAVKAFEFFAFDFLLKPFKDERFVLSLQRALEYLNGNSIIHYKEKWDELVAYASKSKSDKVFAKRDRLMIKLGNKATILKVVDIRYILANGYYAEIFTAEKKYVLRTSLTKLIEHLDGKLFSRIHRSTIVNLDFIQEIVFSDFGEVDVKMKDQKLFRVSKAKKGAFVKKLSVE